MRGVRRALGKREEDRAEWLDTGMEMKARDSGINCLQRTTLVEKPNLGKAELSEMKEDRYSFMVSLPLTQKEVTRARRGLKENYFRADSLR